jgi:hypothetical protein
MRQLGNAVPFQLGEIEGRSVAKALFSAKSIQPKSPDETLQSP